MSQRFSAPLKVALPLLLCLASTFFIAAPAAAQPDGTWAHRFEDHTVYLDIQLPMLSVWRVSDRGECLMMPSRVRWQEETLLHSAGTRWTLTRSDDTLTVSLADTTLQYRRTSITPRQECNTQSQEI
jgi:hypothetical protein